MLRLLPKAAAPYIRLLRLDRPIGIWLLAWPALWGLGFAFHNKLNNNPESAETTSNDPSLLFLVLLFLCGAFLTRSAGCIINDIIDRKIDAKVARTKSRPIASGAISVPSAFLIMGLLLLAAFILLLQLNNLTIGLGVFILIPIIIYPFMKRWTYWPQAMLSLCFSWAPLMGWTAVTNNIDGTSLLILIAAFSWTMAFDTIYAHQDKSDDSIIGMKSTALKFGKTTPKWLAAFFIVTLGSLFVVALTVGAKLIFFTFFAMACLQAVWQVSTLDIDNPDNCLTRFRANGLFGLFITVGIFADYGFASLINAAP